LLDIGLLAVAINFALGILVILMANYARGIFSPAWRTPWLLIASSGIILVAITGIFPALYISYRENLYSLVWPTLVIVVDRVIIILVIFLLSRVAYKLWGKRFKSGFFMIDEATFSSIRSRLTKIYGEAPTRVLMYSIGKEAGERSNSIIENLEKKSGREFLVKLFTAQSEVGWGTFEITDYREGEQFTVMVHMCFESETSEESKHRCDFVRGYISGAASLITVDGVAETMETLCTSYGDPYCEFVTRFSSDQNLINLEEV